MAFARHDSSEYSDAVPPRQSQSVTTSPEQSLQAGDSCIVRDSSGSCISLRSNRLAVGQRSVSSIFLQERTSPSNHREVPIEIPPPNEPGHSQEEPNAENDQSVSVTNEPGHRQYKPNAENNQSVPVINEPSHRQEEPNSEIDRSVPVTNEPHHRQEEQNVENDQCVSETNETDHRQEEPNDENDQSIPVTSGPNHRQEEHDAENDQSVSVANEPGQFPAVPIGSDRKPVIASNKLTERRHLRETEIHENKLPSLLDEDTIHNALCREKRSRRSSMWNCLAGCFGSTSVGHFNRQRGSRKGTSPRNSSNSSSGYSSMSHINSKLSFEDSAAGITVEENTERTKQVQTPNMRRAGAYETNGNQLMSTSV